MATYAEIKSVVDGFLDGCASMVEVSGGFDQLIADMGVLIGDESIAELELREWLANHQYLGYPWIK